LRERIFTLEQELKENKEKYDEAYRGLKRAEDYI
jgi:hypothetical protein